MTRGDTTNMKRFCGTCMTLAGGKPADSKLALPGCKQGRMAYCDGVLHNRVVIVGERGEYLREITDPDPSAAPVLEAPVKAGHSLFASART
jgi:hypothetical protein